MKMPPYPPSTMSEATTGAAGGQSTRVARQEKPFACTMEWCQHRFDTLLEMKYHKKYDPEHFFCKKCDVDCEDWESLTIHKVDNMAPYLEGRKPSDDDLRHITCEFCGEDFKSFGGRKRHRTQMHPANQDIHCPGCSAVFIRASYFVHHLEHNECPEISALAFVNCIQHKYIVRQLLEIPLHSMHHGHEHNATPGAITDGDESVDQDSGGVSLLDDRNEAQLSGYKAMVPESTGQSSSSLPQPTQESWPRMPPTPSIITTSMESMTIRKEAPARSAHTNSMYNASASKTATPHIQDQSEKSSQATTIGGSERTQPVAWGSGKTASALFPAAKARKPVNPGDWSGYLVASTRGKEDEVEKPNMFRPQFWNPNSKGYSVAQFWSELLNAYYCPFPSCANGAGTYAAASDIETHIKLAHMMTWYRCPLCMKRFDKAARLVGHVESSMKCRVKENNQFGSFLDEITGGFLKSKHVGEPKIYRPETAVVKHGQPGGGVMATRFEAKNPNVQ